MYQKLAIQIEKNPELPDYEDYVQIPSVKCPFDASHIMQPKKLLTHINKCKSPNKKLYVQCKYDPCHWTYPGDRQNHYKYCRSRIQHFEYDPLEENWEDQQIKKQRKKQKYKQKRQKKAKKKQKDKKRQLKIQQQKTKIDRSSNNKEFQASKIYQKTEYSNQAGRYQVSQRQFSNVYRKPIKFAEYPGPKTQNKAQSYQPNHWHPQNNRSMSGIYPCRSIFFSNQSTIINPNQIYPNFIQNIPVISQPQIQNYNNPYFFNHSFKNNYNTSNSFNSSASREYQSDKYVHNKNSTHRKPIQKDKSKQDQEIIQILQNLQLREKKL